MVISWHVKIHHSADKVACSSERVFATARHSKLICLNSTTGEELWCANILSPWGRIALNNSTVFYLNQHDFLEAFDVGTGERVWSKKLGGTFGWLHASETHLVVGGWRGYTDLHCLDASTGEVCWTLPTISRTLNRTFISSNQMTIGIAFGDTSELTLFEISSGQKVKSESCGGLWTQNNVDFIPQSSSGSWKSLATHQIFQDASDSIYRVNSDSLSVERYKLGKDVYSQNLEEHSKLVVFMGENSSLQVLNLKTQTLSGLGMVRHNREGLLPTFVESESSLFVGTSFGLLHHFLESNLNSEMKVGKRVSTPLSFSGGHLCFGTASGEIMGVRI